MASDGASGLRGHRAFMGFMNIFHLATTGDGKQGGLFLKPERKIYLRGYPTRQSGLPLPA